MAENETKQVEAMAIVAGTRHLAVKIEVYEEADGTFTLENVRVEAHEDKGEIPDDSDGLRRAVVLNELPVTKFAETHQFVEPEAILVFRGNCVFYGGKWHY